VEIIPQVIDAMGDNGDCQREHQYRKLANPLLNQGIGPSEDRRFAK